MSWKPTIGRIVEYVQGDFEGPTNGSSVHPAMITRVWSDLCVNLTVFFDGEGADVRSSVMLWQDLGKNVHNPNIGWRWPKQKALTAAAKPSDLDAAIASKPGEKMTKALIESRIRDVAYLRLNDTVTLCSITLDNGYSVRGESACVDPANYDQEIGEGLAHSNAFAKLWPLFGFLLAEERYWRVQAVK
jgi:hypothetical protein